jgi:hypothetical protein
MIMNGAPAQHSSIASLRAVSQFSGFCPDGAPTAPAHVVATMHLPIRIQVNSYLSVDRSPGGESTLASTKKYDRSSSEASDHIVATACTCVKMC